MTGSIDPSKLGRNPNEPRQIRTRTGMTDDPLPEGKKLAEKAFPNITPAKHDEGHSAELSKEEVKSHKQELKNMLMNDDKKGGTLYNTKKPLSKRDPVNSATQKLTGREPHAQR